VTEFAIQEKNGSVTFGVRVVPRASRTEIVGVYDGMLKIKLKSPPVGGAANDELIRFLSKQLEIPTANIEIISGQTSRAKRLRIKGLISSDFDRFLQGKT
jgi:uncharacterized protein (TIGR00251 family)